MTRSPFFYVGDKYKLMGQLTTLFPQHIDTYYDAFTGGGSAFLNVDAKRYVANDIDKDLVSLHKTLSSYAANPQELFRRIYKIIEDYNLSCSFNDKTVPAQLKIDYPKTYFAKFNKEAYVQLRSDFNDETDKDLLKLYVLLIYGFNHMLRFNTSGKFNLPVGNVDFNKNVATALHNYLDFMQHNDVLFSTHDYAAFIKKQTIGPNDFVYIDPPYLISASEYNKLWGEQRELELYALLDELHEKGVRFGLSNMLEHKGKKNVGLEKWAAKYHVHPIKSNYISFNDNSVKIASREVYITNYA